MVAIKSQQLIGIAALNFAAVAQARLDKPLIKPEIPSLDGGLFKNLKPTQSTHDQWEWGCMLYSVTLRRASRTDTE